MDGNVIVTDVNKLRTVCDPVTTEDDTEALFTALETEIRRHPTGLGLSAPQIGIVRRAFVYWGSSGVQDTPRVLHRVQNPRVLETDGELINSEEGCLSLPGVFCAVQRSAQITAEDELGGRYVLTGDDARVYQHETDHLNGILILDRGVVIPKQLPERNKPCYCGSGKKFKKCHGR